MKFLKKLAVIVLYAVFSLSLVGLALVVSANRAVGNPETIKETFQSAELYPAASTEINKQIIQNIDDNTTSQVNQTALNDALEEVINPKLVQTNIEEIVDGTYGWLDGTTMQPQFSIDTGQIQTDVQENIINSAIKRVDSLPACSQAELFTIDVNNIDPFALTCNPGLDPAELRQQYSEVANSTESFLGSQTDGKQQFTASDLTSDTNTGNPDVSTNIFEQFAFIPTSYQTAKYLPYLFGALIVFSSLLIIFKLSPNKHAGLKQLSVKLLLTGGSLVVLILLSKYFMDKSLFNLTSEAFGLQEPLIAIINSLARIFNKTLILIAGLYLLLAVAGIYGSSLKRTKKL